MSGHLRAWVTTMNSRTNLDNQDAVILHQHDYRTSSLIVHFFSSEFGKISAIAKGVKGKTKARHNQTALFQPFQKLKISLTGKHDLLTLTNIELNSDNSHVSWTLKGKALYCAYYVNEVLLRLLPTHTDCQEIFSIYNLVLDSLAKSPQLVKSHQLVESPQPENTSQDSIHYEVPLRLFELKLLEFLGYGLNLSNEILSGFDVESHQQYFYEINSGPSLVKQSHTKQLAISGKTLINLQNGQLSDQKTLQESKQLLKWALAEHLGNKPLKSRVMFKQLYC